MKHCLVVDSSPIVRKVAAVILKDFGLRVEQAESDYAAIAHCRIEMPDLLFIDWRLPHGGAVMLLDQIKGLSRLRQPRMIMWTTINDPAELRLAKAAGAHEMMLKPFDRRAFAEVLGQSAAAA